MRRVSMGAAHLESEPQFHEQLDGLGTTALDSAAVSTNEAEAGADVTTTAVTSESSPSEIPVVAFD